MTLKFSRKSKVKETDTNYKKIWTPCKNTVNAIPLSEVQAHENRWRVKANKRYSVLYARRRGR